MHLDKVCAHTNTCTHECTHTNACMHTGTHRCTQTHVYIHANTCTHISSHTSALTNTCSHAHIHECTHIHTHTHTSTHTHREMTPRPWRPSLAPCDPPELGRQENPCSPTTEGVRGQSRGSWVPGCAHRRAAVPAAIPGPALGQTLLLLVQRPRLQDHLLQLEGGIAVQAAFLWRMVLSQCPATLTRPGHPRPVGLRWARSLAPPSSRSAQPTAHRPEQGPPARPAGWTHGAWGSR